MSGHARILAFTSWKNWANLKNQHHVDWWYLAKDFPNRVDFLRDKSNSWYIGEDAGQSHVSNLSPSSHLTVAIGSSMGGFAAAIAAARLGIKRAICIVPQTIVGTGAVHLGDRRFEADYARLDASACAAPFLDLRPIVEASTGTLFTVIIGSESPVDLRHLDRIKDLPNVEATILQGLSHAEVARHCKDSGFIDSAIRQALP